MDYWKRQQDLPTSIVCLFKMPPNSRFDGAWRCDRSMRSKASFNYLQNSSRHSSLPCHCLSKRPGSLLNAHQQTTCIYVPLDEPQLFDLAFVGLSPWPRCVLHMAIHAALELALINDGFATRLHFRSDHPVITSLPISCLQQRRSFVNPSDDTLRYAETAFRRALTISNPEPKSAILFLLITIGMNYFCLITLATVPPWARFQHDNIMTAACIE